MLAAGLLLPTVASAQWVRQTPPRGLFSLTDVHFTDATHGYASAAIGGLMKTVDGGQNWRNVPTGIGSSLRDVYFVHPDTGYVVGNVGVIISTRNGGATWTRDSLPNTGSAVNGVYFHNGMRGFVTQGDVIFGTIDGGATWDTAYVYNGALPVFTFRFLEFATPQVGYAVGGYSGSFGNIAEIAKTTDGGRSWRLIPTIVGTSPMGAAAAVAFPDSLFGYVADVSNRLFGTRDGGQTWQLIGQNHFGAFYGMYFTDRLTGYGAGHNGNLRRTTDGGVTWQDLSLNQVATYAGVFFPTPTVGYVVGDNGSGAPEVLKYEDPLGLPGPLALAGIGLAPNPATDVVRLSNLPATATRVALHDATGRAVRQARLTGDPATTLGTAGLAPGLYVLRLESGGRTYQQKLVIE